MPSLVTVPPRELKPLKMDKEDKSKKTLMGGNLKCKLQHRSRHFTPKDGHCYEELSQWSKSLAGLLSSKYGMLTFQAFLKSEFSEENIEFWLVCEDYKKIKSSFRMSCRARKIFKHYIQAGSPREINIDHKTRELIGHHMKSPTTVSFDEAQKIVYGLMERDSYPRFLQSDVYRTMLGSTSTTKC